MKKLALILIFILSFSFTLTACVTENNGDEISTPDQTTVDVETTTENITDGTTVIEGTTTEAEITTVDDSKKMTLRIGSYNIANGKVVSHVIKKLADDILANDLDIVGFQEVDKFAKRSGYIDTMALLAQYTGYQYYSYTVAINIAGNESVYGQKGEYGTGILSKYPILETKHTKLASGGNEQRMLGYAKIDVNGQIINFYNTHLSYEDTAIRTGQFQTIANELSGKEFCLLTGDFNISSLSEYSAIPFLNTTCNSKNNLTTFPSSGKCIDNILFSNEFTLVKSAIGAVGNSDHNLLYAEFTFPVE